jgi:hypothetical protein
MTQEQIHYEAGFKAAISLYGPAIEAIAEERIEQKTKHGRSVEYDVAQNSTFEKPLTKAAAVLTLDNGIELAAMAMKPQCWSQDIWDKMTAKPYRERLVIAAALIAAEIDRLDAYKAQREINPQVEP